MKKESYSALCDALRNLDVDEAVAVFNEMCYRLDDSSRLIFEMKNIDDMFGEISAKEVLRLAYMGEFDFTDAYVYQLGKNAYLYSFNSVNDKNFNRVFDVIEIADFLIETCNIVEFVDTAEYKQRFKEWLLNIFVSD